MPSFCNEFVSETSSGSCSKIPILDTSILHRRENTKKADPFVSLLVLNKNKFRFQEGIPLHTEPKTLASSNPINMNVCCINHKLSREMWWLLLPIIMLSGNFVYLSQAL